MEQISGKKMMQKLRMIRGQNNKFYFIESDEMNSLQ